MGQNDTERPNGADTTSAIAPTLEDARSTGGSIDSLTGLSAFVRVAEAGGFAEAARRGRVSASALTKAVNRLEASLGTALFVRTTRSVRLTEEGSVLLDHARRIVDEVADAETALAGTRAEPQGTLRVSVPVAFGEFVLTPVLPSFLARHPRLSVRMELSDRMVSIAEEGFDVAVRIAPQLADSALVATVISPHRVGLYAAPNYIGMRGEPRFADELSSHDCVGFLPPGAAEPLSWIVGNERHEPDGRLTLNNDAALLRACVAGQGIAALPDFVAADAIVAGTLQSVLGAARSVGSINALRPSRRSASAKVTAFVAFVRDAASVGTQRRGVPAR